MRCLCTPKRHRCSPAERIFGDHSLPKRSGRRCVYWYIIAISVGVVSVGLRSEKLMRTVAVWICMLAVALLYVPLMGAALVGSGIDCCAGGFCPVRGHQHKTQKPVASQDAMPMDCAHDMKAYETEGMSDCSMSCCQSSEHPTLIPGAFVLPDATVLAGAGEVIGAVQVSAPKEISRLSKPLSPPPRICASVL